MNKSLRILLVPLFLLAIIPAVHSQVKQAKAYLRVSSPGNIPVDDNGVALNSFITERFIILELPKTQKPVISSVAAGKYSFKATGEKIDSPYFIAGKTYSSESTQKIRISRPGYVLWKFNLQAVQPETSPEPLTNIIIRGTLNRKAFRLVLKKEIQLSSQPVY